MLYTPQKYKIIAQNSSAPAEMMVKTKKKIFMIIAYY